MVNFVSEICGFLRSCDLPLYKVGSGYGYESIQVDLPSGEGSRTMQLLGNIADTFEQAKVQQEAAQAEISRIYSESESYPLVITEDRWRSQKSMMQSRILSHLEIFTQIYARNCEIKRIDKATAREFLEANHSYGDAACKYRYGLYLKRHTGHNAMCHSERSEESLAPGTLVAVATFSNARKWIKGDKTIRSYEWTRYASLPGIRLSGGMGKVLKAFIKEVQPDDIMTYADLEWSEGNVYEQLGFTLEGTKNPVTFIIDEHWMRHPIKDEINIHEVSEARYFQNFGSNKYRLKLTDYQ